MSKFILMLTLFLFCTFFCSCSKIHDFNINTYIKEYESAVKKKDIHYFEEHYSKELWVGNKYKNRSDAINEWKRIFKHYQNLSVKLNIIKLKKVSKVTVITFTIANLTGSDLTDKKIVNIGKSEGTSFYFFENGRWCLYKTREKSINFD